MKMVDMKLIYFHIKLEQSKAEQFNQDIEDEKLFNRHNEIIQHQLRTV